MIVTQKKKKTKFVTKWSNFKHIPLHITQDTHNNQWYPPIQKHDPGIQQPSLNEIANKYLDDDVKPPSDQIIQEAMESVQCDPRMQQLV